MSSYNIEEWCASCKGAVKEFKLEWNALLYTVGGKMFALIGHNGSGEEIISLKAEPAYSEQLREQFTDITAGYYLNKTHWNSIKLDGQVPAELIKELIETSYRCVLGNLRSVIPN